MSEEQKIFARAGDIDDEPEPWYIKNWTSLRNGILVLIWAAVGIGVTMKVAGWTFITATYVIVQIITTIGYGDMTIPEDLRLFMSIYVLFGIAIVASVVNDFFNKVLSKSTDKMRAKLRNFEKRALMDQMEDDGEAHTTSEVQAVYGATNYFIASFAIFLFFLIVGAVFYRFYEYCSCSYGKSLIEGCIEGELCSTTGGATKDTIDCIYMAVITMVTVGFGDFSPTSRGGRIFGIFWMILGVLATGNFIGAISSLISAHDAQNQRKTPAFCKELFQTIDKNNDGVLRRSEFMEWVLVTEGLVEKEDIDRVNRVFDSLDTNKSGVLEYSTLYAQFMADESDEDFSS